jgi:hypothetical protein
MIKTVIFIGFMAAICSWLLLGCTQSKTYLASPEAEWSVGKSTEI